MRPQAALGARARLCVPHGVKQIHHHHHVPILVCFGMIVVSQIQVVKPMIRMAPPIVVRLSPEAFSAFSNRRPIHPAAVSPNLLIEPAFGFLVRAHIQRILVDLALAVDVGNSPHLK